MVKNPVINTNASKKGFLYFLSFSTLQIARIGIKNKIAAMIGPPKSSIKPKILGLS